MAHTLTQTALPPQAAALLTGRAKVQTYEATGGLVTQQFARHNLSLLPPIPAGALIHDNSAGAGTVSRLLLTQQQQVQPDFRIFATDIDQAFLDVLAEDAEKNKWPVEVSNQRSEATTFADATFDLDIANIAVIFWGGGGADGVREVYRTLKPGGTALLSCWAHITWMPAVIAVHHEFRGEDAVYPAPPVDWLDGRRLRQVLLDAGFDAASLRLERQEVEAVVREEEFGKWCERAWAFLAGIGGWRAVDGERWGDEVRRFGEVLREQGGTTVEGGEVRMKASQWVAVVRK